MLLGVGLAAQADLDVALGDAPQAMAELVDDELGGVGVDHLVDGRHHAHLHQRLDHVGAALGHAVGELLHGDRLGHHHVAHDLGRLLLRLHAARCFSRSRARRTEARLRMRSSSSELRTRRHGELGRAPARLVAARHGVGTRFGSTPRGARRDSPAPLPRPPLGLDLAGRGSAAHLLRRRPCRRDRRPLAALSSSVFRFASSSTLRFASSSALRFGSSSIWRRRASSSARRRASSGAERCFLALAVGIERRACLLRLLVGADRALQRALACRALARR